MRNDVGVPVFQGRYSLSLPRPDRLYRRFRQWKRQSNLTTDEANAILDSYGIELEGPVSPLAGASRSTNALLETGTGKKILKRYRDTVEHVAIVHEHSILSYLGDIGFPVPHLTPTKNGETLVQAGGNCYALFDYLGGYFQYHNFIFFPPQSGEFIASAGKTLAHLHLALKDFVPAGYNPNGFKSSADDRWRDLAWLMERLDWCRCETRSGQDKNGASLSTELLQRATWLDDSLHGLDSLLKSASLPRLIIHGDYGPYNLLFKRRAAVVVLDLELARLDWRLTDLSTALEKFAKNRRGVDPAKMRGFLEAYHGEFPVDPDEMSLLPTVWRFWMLWRIVVWWHRYCTDGDVFWLSKARRELNLLDWLLANESGLSDLCKSF